ncbi:MAG: glycosyltransferase family 4 protein [Pseudomonadota bacterium]
MPSTIESSHQTRPGLKIVHVVRAVHPHGGVSGVVYALDMAMRRAGVASSIVARTQPDPNSSLIAEKLRLLYEVLVFTVSASVKAAALRKDPDTVVIVHNEGLVGDIYVDHGLHKGVVARNPAILLRNPLHPFMLAREELRHRLRLQKNIVALSRFSLDEMHKYFPSTRRAGITVIPNGVDLERFAFSERSATTTGFRLIFVGHEFRRKGLALVLEALALLPDDVQLTVVGGPEDEIRKYGELARATGVAPRVSFLGRRKDINQILGEYDALVLPSAFESWQLVALEAMASGVPVVMTPVGCAQEVVRDGMNGYLVAPDAKDIADKILRLRNSDDMMSIRREARRSAENYSWDAIASKYIDLCEKIRAKRPAD